MVSMATQAWAPPGEDHNVNLHLWSPPALPHSQILHHCFVCCARDQTQGLVILGKCSTNKLYPQPICLFLRQVLTV
jgi:hypothetical protein